jgi:hypothetical protein
MAFDVLKDCCPVVRKSGRRGDQEGAEQITRYINVLTTHGAHGDGRRDSPPWPLALHSFET